MYFIILIHLCIFNLYASKLKGPVNYFSAQRELHFVQNLEDFIIFMHSHVYNVESLGLYLFDNYFFEGLDPIRDHKTREFLPSMDSIHVRMALGVPPTFKMSPDFIAKLREILQIRLAAHDSSKINTSKKFIQKYKKYHQQYNIEVLALGYGVNFYAPIDQSLTEREKKQLKKAKKQFIDTVKRINDIDADVKKDIENKYTPFEGSEITNEILLENSIIRSVVNLIEDWADKTERYLNMVTEEEMGKKTVRTAEYLNYSSTLTYAQKRIIAQLEFDYSKVTMTFPEYKKELYKFYKKFHKYGIDFENLDSIRKFEILPHLNQYEEHSPYSTTLSDNIREQELKIFKAFVSDFPSLIGTRGFDAFKCANYFVKNTPKLIHENIRNSSGTSKKIYDRIRYLISE